MTVLHTPTPWVQHGEFVETEDDCLAECVYNTFISKKEQMANAAFIVRAVNSHDALVAALKSAYDLIAEEVADGEYTEQAAQIRAALAEAEKP